MFFRDPDGKAGLLEWIQRGVVAVGEVPTSAYADIRSLIRKYSDRDIDFADAAIGWLAEITDCRVIRTVDVRDFGVFRLGKSKRLELVKWFER
jgi:predicted nucleic acid-binding protein